MTPNDIKTQTRPQGLNVTRLLNTLPGPLVLAREDATNNTVGFINNLAGQVGDMVISDPKLSSCGRFTVDPLQDYGVTEDQAKALTLLNDTITAAAENALNAMCLSVQELLGVTDGGLASHIFSGHGLQGAMREALAVYAMAELRSAQEDAPEQQLAGEGQTSEDQPVREYEATVTRVSYGARTFRLSARSAAEAKDIAEDDAGNHLYSEQASEYVVEINPVI